MKPLPLDLDLLERAFRDPVDARRGAPRRPRLAARRPGLPAARPRGAGVVHRRLARQHRRQRAHRVRGAARSARLRQVRSLPGQGLRPAVALRPAHGARAGATTAPIAAPRPGCSRAACSRTARRARPSSGRRRAEAAGDPPEAQHARLLLDLVSTRLDRDPEIPLAPGEELAPPVVPAKLAAAHPELRRAGERRVPRRAGRLPRPPLRHRLQGPGEVARGALDRPRPGLLAPDRLPRLQGRVLRRRHRRAQGRWPTTPPSPPAAPRRSTTWAAPTTPTPCTRKAVDALERYIRSQTVLGRPLLPGPNQALRLARVAAAAALPKTARSSSTATAALFEPLSPLSLLTFLTRSHCMSASRPGQKVTSVTCGLTSRLERALRPHVGFLRRVVCLEFVPDHASRAKRKSS